ncbi:MAG: hypothetical protein ABIM88_05345, partial [candidate division WOR-3 bacterium]
LFILTDIWVVDTLWPSDTLDFDAMALNPKTGTPGVVFNNGAGMLCLAEYNSSEWALDTVTLSAATPRIPAGLAYDTSGTPHVVFVTGGKSIVYYSTRIDGTWQEEYVDSASSQWFFESVSIGLVSGDSLCIITYSLGLYNGASAIAIYTRNGSSWVKQTIVHGYFYFDWEDYSKYLLVEIFWPSPIDPDLSSGFDLLYCYYYKNTGYMGSPAEYVEIRNKSGWVYAHWDNYYQYQLHLNMTKGNWCWRKGNVTYVNTSIGVLPIVGVDLEEPPSGEIIAVGRAGAALYVYTYNGSWWGEVIGGEMVSGCCTIVLTPDTNLFIAYKSSDGLLHIAHKFFTVGAGESQAQNLFIINRTAFLRGQEVRLDREYDLVVYDLSGRPVISGRMARFSTATLSPGVYVLEAKGVGRQAFVVK